MIETILFVLAMLLIIGVCFIFLSDALAVLAAALEPIIRWIQRVVFGIDQPRVGTESLIGKKAKIQGTFVRSDNPDDVQGSVLVEGEVWRARSKASIDEFKMCSYVGIVSRDGTELLVEPIPEQECS